MYRCVFDRAQAWLHNVCPAPQTRRSDTSSHVQYAGGPGSGFLKNRVSGKSGKGLPCGGNLLILVRVKEGYPPNSWIEKGRKGRTGIFEVVNFTLCFWVLVDIIIAIRQHTE